MQYNNFFIRSSRVSVPDVFKSVSLTMGKLFFFEKPDLRDPDLSKLKEISLINIVHLCLGRLYNIVEDI